MQETASVWVLTCGRGISCGVFTTRELGEQAIKKYGLRGMLTQYPLDSLTYDWAIEQDLWKPKKPHETEPKFIGTFSPRTPHYHYGLESEAPSGSPTQPDE